MKKDNDLDIEKIIESLSLIEKKILPLLEETAFDKLMSKAEFDSTTTLRALEFLSNKNIITLKRESVTVVDIGTNGLIYKKHGLPERKLLNIISQKKSLALEDAKKLSNLNDNEFKVSIGVLKRKALINVRDGKIIFTGGEDEISHKSLEENFLEFLPKKISELNPEERYAFDNLKNRKNIIDISDKKIITYSLTELGIRLMNENLNSKLIETISPEIIKSWKGEKFRRYDIKSKVPRIHGGKIHFVNQAIEYAKKIWLEMGFKEMEGNLVQSSFWNFDALFTAQDHPVREMQDTFFIKNKSAKIKDKSIMEGVKKAHEGRIKESKGWMEKWDKKEATKVVLRTHTTCLSLLKLKEIAKNKEFPSKYFALGKCFRNETVDWNHSFEFNQTEGIVVDENANFSQLLGYLIEFFKKMGYEKIRIRPGYFPYTEPSLEIDIFHPFRKEWVELGGAGMFRPEVTTPIFGKHIPVLAWGPGFDRIIMEYFGITDLRDMYKNDINMLREMRVWNR